MTNDCIVYGVSATPHPHPTVIVGPHQKRVEMIHNTSMYQFNMNIGLCGNNI